jgi:hypothetical protein
MDISYASNKLKKKLAQIVVDLKEERKPRLRGASPNGGLMLIPVV